MSTARDRRRNSTYTEPRDRRRAEHAAQDYDDLPGTVRAAVEDAAAAIERRQPASMRG